MSVQNARSCLAVVGETSSGFSGIDASDGLRLEMQSTHGLHANQSNAANGVLCSRLTQSLQQHGSINRNCCREAQEVQAILQNATISAPATTLFGVSPPVRTGWAGGAANPIAHDSAWTRAAYSASHMSLQALRELETSGASFLRGDILVGSPEGDGISLAKASVPYQARHITPSCNSQAPFPCHVQYFAV